MNDCNGYTKFEYGPSVKSESNKYVEFNSKLRHIKIMHRRKKTGGHKL